MNIDKPRLLAGVNEPENYYCAVWAHTVHHSELAVRIISDRDETPTTQFFYWIFSGVLFYEGPLKWQGADFSFDDSECDTILMRIYPTLNNSEKIVIHDLHRLFKFIDKMSGLEVKILASGVIRLEKLP
jgi:hypothetical protein